MSFVATALWGLLVLFAFIGWGGQIEERLFATRTADTGLRGAWGMAFALFVTGSLALFSLASKPVILTFVAAGVVLGCVRAATGGGARARGFKAIVQRWGGLVFASLAAVSIAAAFVQYLGSICDVRFNVNDDFIAYFAFAKQIVQRGTLFDPFNTRLAMAFGGQSFLHAIVLTGAPSFRLHMLDAGICLLMTVLLVIGSRKDNERAWPTVLALLIVVTLPSIKINTHSEFSGVVLFYGLVRTLTWIEESDHDRHIAAPAILALLAAAACTLRSNYIAVAIPMLALSYTYCIWKEPSRRASVFREAIVAASLGLVSCCRG